MKNATLNGKDLLIDWGLRVEKMIITPPDIDERYIEVPYGPVFDLTEQNGAVNYLQREITLELGGLKRKKDWNVFYMKFLNEYHGKEVIFVNQEEPEYFYKGRAAVKNNVERVARIGKFAMSILAEPYKYDVKSSNEPWEWDKFNFETGVIKEIVEFDVNGETTKLIPASGMSVVPVFVVSEANNLSVTLQGKTFKLENGRNRFPEIKIVGSEEKTLIFKGNGRVSVVYRGKYL